MVNDHQVKLLWRLAANGTAVNTAAACAGMSAKTGRKYLGGRRLPSELERTRHWRTRQDPYAEVWGSICELLKPNPELEAKTLLDWLQEQHPQKFSEGQLRTLQRRIKIWRALEGPAKEVFFPQVHYPADLAECDFTDMRDVGVTIQGQPFKHLLFHFVLTYSNWESVNICFSESFESLSDGLQKALWELGGVPKKLKTDRLSAAVVNLRRPAEFTRRYQALLAHYKLEGLKISPRRANENGDVEQSHNRFKGALSQALMLRGSRNFQDRAEYETYLQKLRRKRNAGRQTRLAEEQQLLLELPAQKLDAFKFLLVRVGRASTITIERNIYSVHSRLRGERVQVRLYAERIEVWYAQRLVETLPRLRGRHKHYIQYRHIIDWLVRKPGAFENYEYRSDLFPSVYLRMAYDALMEVQPANAIREYLQILLLAAHHSESAVNSALRLMFEQRLAIGIQAVQALVEQQTALPSITTVNVDDVDLNIYDQFFSTMEFAA